MAWVTGPSCGRRSPAGCPRCTAARCRRTRRWWRSPQQVNAEVLAREGSAAERLGSIDRVTAERHGAIRVGTPGRAGPGRPALRRDGHAPGRASTTCATPSRRRCRWSRRRSGRSTGDELARNPFRVFTSVLVPEDRRFFDADLEARLQRVPRPRARCSRPSCWSWPTGPVAERRAGRRPTPSGSSTWPTAAFALSPEPIDRAWYDELSAVSAVAADIAGVTSTHINHLTPRVLDIDELYRRMQDRGITMIDEIQGPPRWDGPDVLLRQTSFRALAEPRPMRGRDGAVAPGELRVRFGEVEARGIALTPAGRDVVDPLPPDPAAWVAAVPAAPSAELAGAGLAWFTATVAAGSAALAGAGRRPAGDAGRSSTRAGCGSTRWSTRTSCRARRPASSGPTWPTTASRRESRRGVARDAGVAGGRARPRGARPDGALRRAGRGLVATRACRARRWLA